MSLISIALKVLGFLFEWKGASDTAKKDLIELGKKASAEGLISVKVSDSLKSKWEKINQQIDEEKKDESGQKA